MSYELGSVVAAVVLAWTIPASAELPEGTRRVSFFGYDDCVALQNESTRVVLCHQAGGRVLEYSLHGVNAIALDDAGRGWLPGNKNRRGASTGGRLDIGPEQTIPKHPLLWEGAWTACDTRPVHGAAYQPRG